jgi:multidrug efflux pump subunit AcrA (membrane-fusion protein)
MKRNSKIVWAVYLLTALFCFDSPLLPQDKPASSDMPYEYVVQKKSFQPELLLKGTIIPGEMEQINLNLKEFKNPLTVKSIVPSGTLVKEGIIVFAAEPEMLDRTIQDATHKLDGMKLDIEQAKSKMATDEKNWQQDIEKARGRFARAQEELKNYKEIEWPLQKDRDDLNVKRNEAHLADQITELQQLEEMYKESEIAGKTKEIVLERAKRDVEIIKTSLDITRRDLDYSRQIKNPRRIKDLSNEENWSKENLELLESRTTLNFADAKQSLADREFELKKYIDYLARLKADRELITIRAKKSGIVIHGDLIQRLSYGKAPAVPIYEEIKEGDSVQTNKTILTFYSPDSYSVITAIPENSRHLVKENNNARIYVNSLPDKVLKATVSKIAALADNTINNVMTFLGKLSLETNEARLNPGLNCLVEFEMDKLNDVIAIPANLLIKRENKSFVKLKAGNTVIEKAVILGASKDDEVWIASGLKEGDIIVLKK